MRLFSISIKIKYLERFSNLLNFNRRKDINLKEILRANSILEFDDKFTRKMNEHNDLDDYYKCLTIKGQIKKIKVPLLFLNSKDDPLNISFGIN